MADPVEFMIYCGHCEQPITRPNSKNSEEIWCAVCKRRGSISELLKALKPHPEREARNGLNILYWDHNKAS